MSEHELRDQMVSLARSLFGRGYAAGGAGNLSVRLPNGQFLATPRGSCLGRLQANRLSVIDGNGLPLSGDRPSKEVKFHLALYRNNPECEAVVHLHSTYLTALSCLKELPRDNAISPFTPYYVMRIGQLPVIPYIKPGDPKIASELKKIARHYRAFLLANHGPVVTGTSLTEAVNNAEELEETAKLFFLLKGHEVNYLTPAQIQELTRMGI